MKVKPMLLSLLLSACMITGCSGAKAEPVIADGGSEEPETFAGKQFNVYQSEYNVASASYNTPLCFPEGTNLSDLMAQRIKDFETEYDCTVVFETSPSVGFCDRVTQLNLTGYVDYDMYITSNGGYPATLANSGYLVPLTEVSDIIDLSRTDKYGSKGEIEAAVINSVPYAVTPAALPGKQSFGTVPIGVFAEGILKDNNLPNIREYIEAKTWTWDTFRQCLRDYTFTDGENTTKAFVLTNFVFLNAAMLSNGAEFIVRDSSSYKSGIDSPNTLEAVDFLKEVTEEYNDCILDNKVEWCKEYTKLADSSAVMTLLGAWSIVSDLPYNVKDYGLFPFPWGPRGEYGVSRALSDGILAIMIPVLTEDPDYAATLISELLEPLPGYETKEELSAYYDNIFFNAADIDLYVSFSDNVSFSYFNVGGYNFSSKVSSDIKRASAAELMQKYAPVMDEVVDKYIAPNGDFLLGE